MPKEETVELRQIRNTIGELNDLPFGNARSSIVSNLRTLIEYEMGTPYEMHLRGRSGYKKTLSNGHNIIDFASDGKYLYALVAELAGLIVKIELETFIIYDTLLITAVAPSRMIIAGGGDGESFLYIIGYNDPCILSKVRLSDFTEVSTITLTTPSGFAITTNGTHLFIAHATRYVTRVNISTFLEVNILDLGALVGSLWAAMCSGTYLYVTELVSPGNLYKIDTDTFTVTSTLAFAAGYNNPTALIVNGNHIYVGFDVIPGRVTKVNEISFSTTGTIILPAGMSEVMTLTCGSESLYCGTVTSPGRIGVIDLASFQYIDYILMSGNEARSLYFDETFLYAGFYLSPGIERTYIIPSASVDSRRIDIINSNIITIDGIADTILTNTTNIETKVDTIDGITDTLLEQIHSGTYYIYPANAAPVSIQSGVGAYTKGNYVEIIPINTILTTFYIVGMYINLQTAAVDYVLDIATGLAGAEVVIVTDSAMYSNVNRSFDMIFPIPIKVAANTRVSVRCSDGTGSLIALVKIRYKN